MVTRYDPWKDLATRYPHVRVDTSTYLGPETMGDWDGNTLRLCSSLNPDELRSTLTHEIVHMDRGIAPPGRGEQAEERLVDDITSRKLIPIDDLASEVGDWIARSINGIAADLEVDSATVLSRLSNMSAIELGEMGELMRLHVLSALTRRDDPPSAQSA